MTTIAIIGGTGEEGIGLGMRFALAGHEVIIGSRDPSRAVAAADTLINLSGKRMVSGLSNSDASQAADIIILSVPYGALTDTLAPLKPHVAGKLMISVIAPLMMVEGKIRAAPVADGSAAREIANLLPDNKIVSAFHHLSAHDLIDPAKELHGDIVVCSDHEQSKRTVMELAEQIPSVRAIDGGDLDNSQYLEQLTALLITINKIYKTRTSLRLLGPHANSG